MAESEEELKSLLMKVKVERENWEENIFEDIIAENLLNLEKETSI